MPAQLDPIHELPRIAREAVVQMGLDAEVVKDVPDEKAVSLLKVWLRSHCQAARLGCRTPPPAAFAAKRRAAIHAVHH